MFMGRQLLTKRSCSDILYFFIAVEVLIMRSDMVPKYTLGTLFKLPAKILDDIKWDGTMSWR